MSFLQKSSQYLKKNHSRHPTLKNPATQHLLQKVEGSPSSLCRLCAYVCDGLLRNRLRIASTTFSTLHSVLIFLGSEPTFFLQQTISFFPNHFVIKKICRCNGLFRAPVQVSIYDSIRALSQDTDDVQRAVSEYHKVLQVWRACTAITHCYWECLTVPV